MQNLNEPDLSPQDLDKIALGQKTSQSKDFYIIIPARFNSKRLPGKPLMDINGKTLIERVYERAMLCGARSVIITTDDDQIEQAAQKFGAIVCRTSEKHLTGTDRLAEAVSILGLHENDIVVNLQGDEPLVPPHCVQLVASAMQDQTEAFLTTICTPILEMQHLKDPNVVKVLLDKNGFALYFSRAMIPYPREGIDESLLKQAVYYRHIGLFAYRVSSLKRYSQFPPSPIECVEHLEQLRVLWQGERIHVSVIKENLPPGVDTLAELEHIRRLF